MTPTAASDRPISLSSSPEWRVNASVEDLMGLGDSTGMIKEKRLELFGILDEMDIPGGPDGTSEH